MVVTTWNVQQTKWPAGDLPWYAFIRHFFNPPGAQGLGADVVCLQQVGAPPDPLFGVTPATPPQWTGAPPWIGSAPPAGLSGRYFRWETPLWNIFILWMETDPGGDDNTLAICSVIPPSALRYVAPPGGGAPAIGMQVNEGPNAVHVFTLRAGAPDGRDGLPLLHAVNAALPGAAWAAAGDYRCPAGSLNPPAGMIVCEPGGPTDAGGRRTDYLIKPFGRTVIGAVFENSGLSTHFPVTFAL